MKQKIQADEIVEGTHGKMKRVMDFLPRPEELVFKEAESEKVTIYLDKDTLIFFKKKAKELGGSYQKMIRNLLSHYTQQMKKTTA